MNTIFAAGLSTPLARWINKPPQSREWRFVTATQNPSRVSDKFPPAQHVLVIERFKKSKA